jgi:uncharacterized membrane protein
MGGHCRCRPGKFDYPDDLSTLLVEKGDRMPKLRNSLFTGILVVLPLFLTAYVAKLAIITADDIMIAPLIQIASNFIHLEPINQKVLVLLAKVLIFFLVLGVITLVGMATQVILFKQAMGFGEGLLLRVPLVNKVYLTIQQISHAFLGKRQVFQKVGLIEYPRKGLFVICFVTSKTDGEIQKKYPKPMVNIFVPTTPNPTSGVFLIVPENEFTELGMTIEDGIKLVVSGGVVAPPLLGQRPS